MNNKGFTMMELLAIILVLTTILLVSFPLLINVSRRDETKEKEDRKKTLCKAGEIYIYNNKDLFGGETLNDIIYIDVKDLMNSELTDIKDSDNKNIYGDLKYTVENNKVSKCDYTEYEKIPNMLIENDLSNNKYSRENMKFLNTDIYSAYILSITFENTINIPSGYEKKDCSYAQDESVMCYWKVDFIEGNESYYEMHVAANGTIYAPYDSTGLFASLGYHELTKLNLENFSTEYVRNMAFMFYQAGYTSMKEIDLGDSFYTKNVYNINSMFWLTGAKAIESINVGENFKISENTSAHNAFLSFGGDLITIEGSIKVENESVKNKLLEEGNFSIDWTNKVVVR